MPLGRRLSLVLPNSNWPLDHKGQYVWSGRPVPDRSAIRNHHHRAAGKCRQVQASAGDCRRCNAAPPRSIPPILRPGDLPRRSEVLDLHAKVPPSYGFLDGGAQVLTVRTSALMPGYSRLCARAIDFALASCDASFSLPSSQSFSRSPGLPLPLFRGVLLVSARPHEASVGDTTKPPVVLRIQRVPG